MHILTPETYQEDYPGFYRTFLSYLQDKNGYLTKYTTHNDINITVQTHFVEDFNRSAKSYMTDAEGTYIYDLVAIGGFANTGADLPLYATEILKDYIGRGLRPFNRVIMMKFCNFRLSMANLGKIL